MTFALAVICGRLVRTVTRLRGGGSALPGWFALRIHPRFLDRVMSRVHASRNTPVAVITGSNGKSTTTSMTVAILEAHGKCVFSNPSGGNLPQGIASAMLADVTLAGELGVDAVVLEVDEAYGVTLVDVTQPTHALLLNVQLDQLNRFFEPDRVAAMMHTIAAPARDVVVNDSDDNTRAIGNALEQGRAVWGFAIEDSAAPRGVYDASTGVDGADHHREPLVTIQSTSGRNAVLRVLGAPVSVSLPSAGVHYAIDAAGAMTLASRMLGDDFSRDTAADAIGSLKPVYGRGEQVDAFGDPLTIIMMKNHPSLQANLDALTEAPESLYLAVDEGTPDPSWIYDIDLGVVDHVDVLAGTKAWQWETRLAYSEIPVGVVDENPSTAFATFGQNTSPRLQPHRTAIVNYEQMMDLRRELGYLEIEGE